MTTELHAPGSPSPLSSSAVSAAALPGSVKESAYDPVPQIAEELGLTERSVRAVAALFAEGATVPFIARYRKEATLGLDEVQIRAIEERKTYLVELDSRRKSILGEIEKQGKLSESLKKRILGCTTKAELEDLYLPFKPKRRTRSTIAEEKGLLPLAELLWAQGEGSPESSAQAFVSAEKEVPDTKAALQGARDIVAERLAEDAEIRKAARDAYLSEGVLVVEKTKAHEDKTTKFDNYAQFSEPVATIASHRYLAVRRGESEGVLRGALKIEDEMFVERALRLSPLKKESVWAEQMTLAVRDAVTRLLLPSSQVDVRVELKMRADKQAVEVFAKNLRELLMAPPLGAKAILGIDPGQRTGCKCVVVDETGKLLANDTIYLVQGDSAVRRAEETILDFCRRFPIHAIAVGNGTHGRETEAFVKKLLSAPAFPAAEGVKPFCVAVSESGASIYSASDVAREEFPDLDLTVRGAISIARRLQDPLAELVKLDPKSIGVGQYQHDVYQPFLGKKLDEVVESAVHEVGVELNTASSQLLSRVSGIGPSLAKRIVEHRNEKGSFRSRKDLLSVIGLGPRAFEQAAGFLRIRGAENPLDASAVHPERYALVERMATDLGVPVDALIGSRELLTRLDKSKYASGDVGTFTLDDIFAELLKPGRDPRKSFEAPQFRDDVTKLEDLKPGMVLEGVVTNVTAFGAFVDVGVHQDGLVHVSKLSERFIKDPSEVVKVGDRLTVRVVEVDLERQRVSLSARKDDRSEGGANATGGASGKPAVGQGRPPSGQHRGNGGKPGGGQPKPQTANEKLTHNPFAGLLRR